MSVTLSTDLLSRLYNIYFRARSTLATAKDGEEHDVARFASVHSPTNIYGRSCANLSLHSFDSLAFFISARRPLGWKQSQSGHSLKNYPIGLRYFFTQVDAGIGSGLI